MDQHLVKPSTRNGRYQAFHQLLWLDQMASLACAQARTALHSVRDLFFIARGALLIAILLHLSDIPDLPHGTH